MKWFIDCMTLGAVVNTVIFIAGMGLLKGQSRDQIVANVKGQTIPIIMNSYKLWPVVSIINFAFIPVEKRIVFLSSIGELWIDVWGNGLTRSRTILGNLHVPCRFINLTSPNLDWIRQ